MYNKDKIIGKPKNGRVLESNENSNLFVYMTGKGDESYFEFPLEDDELWAETLADIVIRMHDKKLYKNIVFYVDSQESGSLFDNW